MSPESSRFSQFEHWCQACAASLGIQGKINLTSIAGDASFRRYYRFGDNAQSYIAVNSPPDQENNNRFTALAKLMNGGGVRVPTVECFDQSMGFIVLEDFGDSLLLPQLRPNTADGYYQKVIATLLDIQQLPHNNGQQFSLLNYDANMLRAELNLFTQWFVTDMLAHSLSEQEVILIDSLFNRLIDSAEQQPQVFVHRDFHSRNLMLLDDSDVGVSKIGVIDFQDAVLGPITYDLVSLYKDCYIRWPRKQVAAWVEAYRRAAAQILAVSMPSATTFLKQFDFMGLQRHIKVLGIFARLYLRDGKSDYLHDLPLVLSYVRETCQQYNELADFSTWFEANLQPLITKQNWYKPRERT